MRMSEVSVPVTQNEVARQSVELLPSRSALSALVDLHVVTVVPVNVAIAVNAATFGSTAAAAAWQGAWVG